MDQLIRLVLDRTGYQRMLEQDPNPEAESRTGNLMELVNAAADAAERGETLADFLDHAALVSDADSVDSGAQVSLLTLHNAKGLEFPDRLSGGHGRGSCSRTGGRSIPKLRWKKSAACATLA